MRLVTMFITLLLELVRVPYPSSANPAAFDLRPFAGYATYHLFLFRLEHLSATLVAMLPPNRFAADLAPSIVLPALAANVAQLH